MIVGETPRVFSWRMSFADKPNNDCELFTKASTTSLPRPALDNLTTSATFGGRLAGGGLELILVADAAEEDEGATGL